MSDDAFVEVVRALNAASVRFLVIGVSGANYYATSAGLLFATQDRDLFLPPDIENTLSAWRACESLGLDLWLGDEPLGRPLDDFLAERIVHQQALVRATNDKLQLDLTYVMQGFDFEAAHRSRRVFQAEGAPIPVASLSDIVASRAEAGRPKDLLFLETHAEALRQLGLPAKDEP